MRIRCTRSVRVLCVLSFFLLSVAFAGGAGTAKSGLGKTITIAKKWKADAILTGISSLDVNSDGTAAWWIHGFLSPSTKKHLMVTVKADRIDTTETNKGFSNPIGDNFLDSDKAMQEAKKNGLKGKNPSMGLNVLGTGKNAGLYWTVTGGFEKGDVSVTLDGRTGKLIRKEVIPGL
jgi:hypothetical protein